MHEHRKVFGSTEMLVNAVTSSIVEILNKAIASRGVSSIALSGGTTPKSVYELLATDEFSSQIRWPFVQMFWGDERCVPPHSSESNYKMVSEALLEKIPIPKYNIHRMKGERPPDEGARVYEKELREFLPVHHGYPQFDLMLLGLGEDGHTASLFSGTPAVEERTRWVTNVYADHLQSHRLTLTLPVINNSRTVMFIVSGGKKSSILKQVLEVNEVRYPAQRVRPDQGTLLWMCDRESTRHLTTPMAS